VTAIGTSQWGQWTRRNTVFTLCSAVTLVAAIEVILFGVVWTHGAYGSRMAWLGGVALPLLVIAAGLAWTGGHHGAISDVGRTGGAKNAGAASRDRRSAPRAIGVASLVLIGIPVAFGALLLVTHGLVVLTRWLI
jgi:hypothetical protein